MTHTFRFFTGAEDYAQKIAIYGNQVLPAGWTVVTTPTVYSARAYKWTCASGSNEWEVPLYIDTNGRWAYPANYGMTCFWVTFHLYIDTLPGAGQYAYFMRFADADTKSQFRITETGAIQVYNKNGASWSAASTGKMVAGVWYVVSVKTYKAGEARCIVRDLATLAEVLNVVHANTVPNENIQFCKIGGGSSFGIYDFDNIVAESAATSAGVDDPFLILGGAYSVLQLLATANGTDVSALWSGSYLDVDENPKDDAATYRQRSAYANNDPITHHVQDPDVVAAATALATILTIEALDVCTYIYGLDAYFGAFVRLRRGAGAWNSPASFLVSNAIYSAQCYLWQADPTDSQPWTESRVIECEAGTQPSDTQHGGRLTANYINILATYRTLALPPARLLHYILDVNDPRQVIRDQFDREVPPEELRPNKWLGVVGWRPPSAQVFADYINDPEKVPINSVRFTEPDDYSLGSGADDLLESVMARLTQRSA